MIEILRTGAVLHLACSTSVQQRYYVVASEYPLRARCTARETVSGPNKYSKGIADEDADTSSVSSE